MKQIQLVKTSIVSLALLLLAVYGTAVRAQTQYGTNSSATGTWSTALGEDTRATGGSVNGSG